MSCVAQMARARLALSGYDADRSYPLEGAGAEPYVWRPPVQPPTAPAYAKAIELERARNG